jgi:hypothetical protein
MSQLETYARTIAEQGRRPLLQEAIMIRLTDRNKPTVEALLKATNGRHKAHVFYSADQIYLMAEEAEKDLALLQIPLIKRVGAEMHCWSGTTVAQAYKYAITVNVVVLVRNTQGWIMEHLAITQLDPDNHVRRRLRLTPDQDQVACGAFRKARSYTVMAPDVGGITVIATESSRKPEPSRL